MVDFATCDVANCINFFRRWKWWKWLKGRKRRRRGKASLISGFNVLINPLK